jgi:hypothetical protein
VSSYSEFANSIAAIEQARGNAIAEGQRQSGQIWGQALGSVGQLVANLPQQLQQAKIQKLQLDQYQQAVQGQQRANQIIAGIQRNPDGTFDTGDLLQKFARAGVPADEQARWGKSFDDLNGIITKNNQHRVDALADVANTVLSHHKDGEPITPDAVHLGFAVAKAIPGTGLTDQDEQQLVQLMGQGADPQQLLEQVRGQGSKYAAQKPVVIPRGGILATEQGQVLAQGQPEPMTPTELQLAAADPKNPRHQEALAAVQAEQTAKNVVTPYQQFELDIRRGELGVSRQREAREATAQNLGMTMGGATVPDVPAGQKNEDFLKTLQPAIASQVKALAEGRMQFPSGFALRSPYWQGLLQAVAKYDPTFDAINYNARAKTRSDFTSGKSAQQVNAINTVIGHLDSLSQATDALKNGNVRLFNQIGNVIARATGNPNITNFNTVKKAVSDEVTRVWRQSGGAEADIKAAQDNLDAANSPAQLHQAIATYGELLESKLGALQNQYQQGMGINDVQMVTPASRATLNRLETIAGRSLATTPTAVPAGRIRVIAPDGRKGTLAAGTPLPAGWKAQ